MSAVPTGTVTLNDDGSQSVPLTITVSNAGDDALEGLSLEDDLDVAELDVKKTARMRKAIGYLKRQQPAVIVAEFNFQSDFRDRTSSLESLLAVVQRMPDTRVVVFYDREYQSQFEKLKARLPVHAALAFPVTEEQLSDCLRRIGPDAGIDA